MGQDELEKLAGRTLMIGLPGPELDAETARTIEKMAPGGVILFRRNLVSVEQTVQLLAETSRLMPVPGLLALDQEGGRVSRLAPYVGATPTAEMLARAGEGAAFRFARATGAALRALGFNLDFAPVVDLCEPGALNGIADRSFGTDPERVAALAGAFLDGLAESGVAGCLKHFPGLGFTNVDSHERLPTVSRTREQLLAEDVLPYRVLGPRAATVMIGHGHYPALDATSGRPASLSPTIVQGLLRSELGYSGLVVSDDLEMGAVACLDLDGAAAVGALSAGCDLLLYCSDLERAGRAHAAIATWAAGSPVSRRRLEEAAQAVEACARSWPAVPGALSAWDAARRDLASSGALA